MAKICSVKGCSKRHDSHGFCSMHSYRWKKYGDPNMGRTPNGKPLTWLMDQLSVNTNECVPWPFAKDRSGHGCVRYQGRLWRAHRLLCTWAHGEPPNPSDFAAHGCGNGHLSCCNKRHLRWATQSENEADRIEHGTSNRGERCGASKLTRAEVQEIRRQSVERRSSELARQYDVSDSTIFDILSGRTWKWLPDPENYTR